MDINRNQSEFTEEEKQQFGQVRDDFWRQKVEYMEQAQRAFRQSMVGKEAQLNILEKYNDSLIKALDIIDELTKRLD